MTHRFTRVAPILPVRDVGAAIAHYRSLGFTVEPYADEGGAVPIYAFVCRGAVHLHLARVAEVDPKTNTSACYLYVDDAGALYDEWRAIAPRGRLIAPVDTPYGLREMAHIDPDGNLLRIGSELAGSRDV